MRTPALLRVDNPATKRDLHELTVPKRTARILRAHARHIQRLGRRAISDVVEIGRRLTDAKRRLGHGRFLVWLTAEFGWSERTAENFMRVYDLQGKFANFADLQVPLSALYLLAAPSTPDKALFAVAARAGTNAGLSVVEVKEIIANSRRASPIRRLVHIAKQIIGNIKNAPLTDVPAIIERYVVALPSDETDGVKNFVHEQLDKRLERHEQRIYQLKDEIERLKHEIERLKQLRAVVPRQFQSYTYVLPPFMSY
jgi:hypothetical protein